MTTQEPIDNSKLFNELQQIVDEHQDQPQSPIKDIAIGKWEQTGKLILSYGEEGSMICEMIEPYPESGLVEAKELKIDSKGWKLQMGNANLIVKMQNACTEINPEHPELVAESILEMYAVIEDLRHFAINADSLSPTDGQIIAGKCYLVLSKIGGK